MIVHKMGLMNISDLPNSCTISNMHKQKRILAPPLREIWALLWQAIQFSHLLAMIRYHIAIFFIGIFLLTNKRDSRVRSRVIRTGIQQYRPMIFIDFYMGKQNWEEEDFKRTGEG